MRPLTTRVLGGGRLVLLEYRKEDPMMPIRLEHKMTVDEALPRQHILIFTVSPNP